MPNEAKDSSTVGPSVIVYGGAFDPPHLGHVQAVDAAISFFPDAVIHIVPGAHPAGAGGQHKAPKSSFAERLHMCQVAFAQASASGRAVINPIELELPAPNYTINTLREFNRRFPGKKLAILLGEDQFTSFWSWHHPREILSLADLVVISRLMSRDPIRPRTLKQGIVELLQKLHLQMEWLSPQRGHVPETEHDIFALDYAICPAESRLIRLYLGAGSEVPGGWLTPEVLQYIRQHDLYTHLSGGDL